MRQPRFGAFLTIVVALTAAALAPPAPAGAQSSVTRLSGVVRDDTGMPIKGAVVTARNPDTAPALLTDTTDDKGRFAILGLRRGVWIFTASAPGYESHEISGPIQPRQQMPLVEFELRKKPEGGPRGALATVDVEKLQESLRSAESLEGTGKLDDALAIYEKVLAQLPSLTAVNGEIGDLYLKKKQPEKALAAYEKWLSAVPESAGAKAGVAEARAAIERLKREI
jgi:hypothetical protein